MLLELPKSKNCWFYFIQVSIFINRSLVTVLSKFLKLMRLSLFALEGNCWGSIRIIPTLVIVSSDNYIWFLRVIYKACHKDNKVKYSQKYKVIDAEVPNWYFQTKCYGPPLSYPRRNQTALCDPMLKTRVFPPSTSCNWWEL